MSKTTCLVVLLVAGVLTLTGCKAAPGPRDGPGAALPANPAPAVRGVAKVAEAAAAGLDADAARVVDAANWLLSILASLPADAQARGRDTATNLASIAKSMSEAAQKLRTEVVAPARSAADDTDRLRSMAGEASREASAQKARADDEAKRADREKKRADGMAESRLILIGTLAVGAGMIGLALGAWLAFTGNVKGGTGVAVLGGCFVACGIAAFVLSAYLYWIGLGLGILALISVAYLIGSRIMLAHRDVSLGVVAAAIEESPVAEAIKPVIAAKAKAIGATKIVKNTITAIKQRAGVE